MNDFEKLFLDIKASFDSLWSAKLKSKKVIEVITPYSTTSNKFVSIFIMDRNGKYIVSDGGLLNSEAYDSAIDYDNQYLLKMLYHYEEYYSIKTAKDSFGTKHYYKTTEKLVLVPNMVYQLSQFISLCVSAATVQLTDEKERNEKETFKKQVNTYLSVVASSYKITLNGSLDKQDFRAVRFNAILTKGGNSISLVNYITGSNVSYFTKSISNASVLFEIADNSKYREFIVNKVAIVNNIAEGFDLRRINQHLDILNGHTGHQHVNWTEKERLAEIFN